jgi:hypothetical protein
MTTPMQQFSVWVATIGGMHRLRHLRGFTLGIELWNGGAFGFDEVQVKVSRGKKDTGGGGVWKLNVEFPKQLRPRGVLVIEETMGWHAVVLEMKTNDRGWTGEAIIDFLTSEPDLWLEHFFSYLPDEEDMDKNRRHEDDQ